MTVPSNFAEAIAAAFYDKTIYFCDTTVDTDNVGWTRKLEPVLTGEHFMGNVRYEQDGKVQEEYGLRDEIDIAITCLKTVEAEKDAVIKYGDLYYLISEVRVFDSHKLIVARKWSSTSSTSISS